ncbi:hypothetical protein [Cystobacter ferrugineus]|uniref:Secreted protein n=1 Tax=Cystobacter ferrugineus TaxID=83449 RepID=A0A1L9B8C3_9BACT|nr:hypothetical protein [Cystobacter ferrugineus]OJH38509.1 hypothetical protein BON30_25355 [Cystobacter ferrugineus]
MRMFGTMVVGMMALLSSPALADLPVINEKQVSWQGCEYSLQVQQDSQPHPIYSYNAPFYRVVIQRDGGSSGTCPLPPGTVELGSSFYWPGIAILGNDEGLVVAFTQAPYDRWFGSDYQHIEIRQLDPSTLGSLRTETLWGSSRPVVAGEASIPGGLYLDSLYSIPGMLQVSGRLNGNSISDGLLPGYEANAFPIQQGSHFVAIYYSFFGPVRYRAGLHITP